MRRPQELKAVYLEEMRPGLLHTSFPIPEVEYVQSIELYALVDKGKALFIDTGAPECTGTAVFRDAMKHGDVPWGDVSVFVTHFHPDHAGEAAWLSERGARIYAGTGALTVTPDAENTFLVCTGARKEGLGDGFASIVRGISHFADVSYPVCELEAGSLLSIGGYTFEVFPMPGHAAGHCGLLDREKGILFCGDHIIDGIVPSVHTITPDQHLLASYFDILKRVDEMKLQVLFPAHLHAVEGPDAISSVIQDLESSYRTLCKRTLSVLRREGKAASALEVARCFYGYLPQGLEGETPSFQGVRAGKIFSYLEYLFEIGEVTRSVDDEGVLLYGIVEHLS